MFAVPLVDRNFITQVWGKKQCGCQNWKRNISVRMKGNHYSRIKSLWCPTWDLICIMEVSEGDLMSCSSTVGNMKTETIF